jgi:hypothetical protein
MSSKRNIPRPLSEDEIEDILSGIEKVTYGVKSATTLAQTEIKNLLRSQLESIELVPAAIPEMKKTIRNQYYRSIIEPQTPVGFLVSEALSQPIMQMTMNTFHQSGSSKNMSNGIDALKELFNVSESRKAYNMVINFNTCDLDYNDVFDMRTKIVEVSFESLIKNYDYVSASQTVPAWTNGYLRLTKQKLPNYQWSLRLFLDTNRMLAFKVSLSKIIQMIKEKAPPNIVIVPSPMSIGVLDLYPDEDQIDKQLGANSSLLFLSVSVLPTIQEFIISGVKGVEGIFPMSHPVLSIIIEEIPIEKGGNQFFLSFSRLQMKKTGIGLTELEKLFSFVDIEILDPQETGIPSDEGVYIVMPESAKNEKGYTYPVKFVKDLLKKEEDRMNEEERRVKEQSLITNEMLESLSKEEVLRLQSKAKGYIAKASDFYQSSKCWYAETNGKNFIEIIKLPEVDPLYSYSNDFYEVSELLGIEATRSILIMEFKNVLLQEEYINSRHIGLIVDIMTNLGRLNPISFYGAGRFGQGAMSLATNQQTMKVFTQAAAFGKKEKVDSVSASIMVGKQAKIGAGFVEVLPAKSKVPPQPNPVQFTEKIDETYTSQILEETLTTENTAENNQAYTDVLSVNIPNPIYAREQKTQPKKLVSDVPISTPKLISPTLIQVASSIKDIEVIGEETLENTVIQDPESQKEIVQVPVKKNQTITEKNVLDIPEEPLVPPSLVPSLVPPSLKRPTAQPTAQLSQAPTTTLAPTTPLGPPSLPAKKKGLSDLMNRVNKKKEEKETGAVVPPRVVSTPKKQPAINVEENINTLSNL